MSLSLLKVMVIAAVAAGSGQMPHRVRFRILAHGTPKVYAVVEVRPFEKAKHVITGKPLVQGGALMTHVDGRFAWGTGGNEPLEIPETELSSIAIHVGVKTISIPTKDVSDLYNVGWKVNERDRYVLSRGASPGVVKLHISASDGYAAYEVLFTVWQDGRCRREINGPGR